MPLFRTKQIIFRVIFFGRDDLQIPRNMQPANTFVNNGYNMIDVMWYTRFFCAFRSFCVKFVNLIEISPYWSGQFYSNKPSFSLFGPYISTGCNILFSPFSRSISIRSVRQPANLVTSFTSPFIFTLNAHPSVHRSLGYMSVFTRSISKILSKAKKSCLYTRSGCAFIYSGHMQSFCILVRGIIARIRNDASQLIFNDSNGVKPCAGGEGVF